MNIAMLLLAMLLFIQAIPRQIPVPYQDFSRAGAGFLGSGREMPEPVGLESVDIGILGPEKTTDGRHLRLAVEMAVEEANAQGGYLQKSIPINAGFEREIRGEGPKDRRIPFRIVFHPDDGPWGTAARQVVQFAYEDRVWAIIGALDGQHTHIAELIVSKAWVPVISPGAADSSIDYANVPWVFRVMPSDTLQAAALISYARATGYKRLVAVTEIDREAHTGYLRLAANAWRQRLPLALHLEYPPTDPREIIPRLTSTAMDAAVVWGSADTAALLIQALRRAGNRIPILGSASLASVVAAQDKDWAENVIIASAVDLSRTDVPFREFCRNFTIRAGQEPSITAFYSYDVGRLVMQAIQRAGLNRALIRDHISDDSFDGLTGRIQFNSLGGSSAAPVLLSLGRAGWKRVGKKQ